ncbi:MAG TPA: amidase [Dehalococcoidia bacterium]|nr:Asp-tRNA(Asn)/Glu-tRNA(Gln) amidotransferase GatCAB subunit A [Chloroflexota bacterium]MDP6056949.1 amidase [Dehalococcoidia bacterium]MDP7261604.1 amidase [Dehalococcoidia bacterium]HJP27720.1 amidase [Dehalococcoidia bacterium]
MSGIPTHYKTIYELAPLIESGDISPVELTQSQLARIELLDGKLKSYATVTADLALEQARTAEREIGEGRYRGKLHGIPIAVKDLCNTAGIKTMGGSAVFANNVPDHDATVVANLRTAGSVLLGKLNMTEGAMGGYNPKLDIPENPWRASHWAGASSSGSGSATAAGLAYGTLGSDTGGSIRHPAAVCGTVGLKPTWGRVSRFGVMDLAESLDHVGPLTRSAADAGIILQAIAGHDPIDPTSLPHSVPNMLSEIGKGVEGLKIGWDEDYAISGMEPSFAAAVESGVKVMEGLGAEIVPVKMPEIMRDAMDAWPVICSSEAAMAHSETFPSHAAEYGPFFREWLEMGRSHSATDYARAHSLRITLNGELRKTMRNIDVLACPSTAKASYPVTPEALYGPISPSRNPWDSRFTVPYDFSGLPTITLPCGLDNNGMPVSLQFAGHHLSEPLLVGIGDTFERATDFHKLHPPV